MNTDPRESLGTRDPDTQPLRPVETGERQRAAIALGVLAIVALVIVGIMVAVLGNSKNTTTTAGKPKGGPAVTVTGGSRPSNASSGPVTKPHRHHHKTRPSNTAVSCPSSAPCDLPDDVGNAVRALNAYRAQHGKPAVHGSVTQAARTCAVTAGDQCPSGFYWEPVGQSGRQVIAKIAANGGDSWLLSDSMTAVQVGWAYIPSSRSFECALVSNAP